MKEQALILYRSMQQDLSLCQAKLQDREQMLETCFRICSNYMSQLEQALAIYSFSRLEEEIDFFKSVKPLFASEMEYYNLLYHAYLFCPEFDREDIEKFWQREAGRLERFKVSHAAFYDYYRSRETSGDASYFSREAAEDPDLYETPFTASADHLVATLLALEKYNGFVHTQLAELHSPSKNAKDGSY